MKKILFLAVFLVPVFITNGQQRFSYAYDAAGNRISRTITVGAYNLSDDEQQESSRFYVETLNGRELTIQSGSEKTQLTIAIKDYNSSLNGKYSLLDKEGALLAGENLSENTLVKLKAFPAGNYTLHIFLDGHHSDWKVVKL